jgi:hypothetical protein
MHVDENLGGRPIAAIDPLHHLAHLIESHPNRAQMPPA